MIITGSLVKEQGVEFGIILVKDYVLNNPSEREEMIDVGIGLFGVTTVLASQDTNGSFRYYGRDDIVDFLANISASQIPWMEYTVS